MGRSCAIGIRERRDPSALLARAVLWFASRRRDRELPRGSSRWLVTSFAFAALATALTATSASAIAIDRLPVPADFQRSLHAQDISIPPCPPRCEAELVARADPSKRRKPMVPEEFVYEGTVEILWDGARGEIILVWGGRTGSSEMLWDGTMEFPQGGAVITDSRSSAEKGDFVSPELRIRYRKDERERVRTGRPRPRDLTRLDVIEAVGEQELDPLSDIPPDAVWDPIDDTGFAATIRRVSRSRTTVLALTAALVVAMVRLAR